MDPSLAVTFAPWIFPREASPQEVAENDERIAQARVLGHQVADSAYIAPNAVLAAETFALGERSYLAAHAHVTGDVKIGADCSVNVSVAVRGTVSIGDGVRIGTHCSLLGFDHGFADAHVPVFQQPHTSRGITIEDDVWFGAQVVVLDGVTVGAHSVIGAGAVVTKDVPPYSIAVGNPARVVRDRLTGQRPGAVSPGLPARLAAFADQARTELPTILSAAWDGEFYRDAPGARPTRRAHCDAVELASLLLTTAPAQLEPAAHVAQLLSGWDAESGLIPEIGSAATGEKLRDEGAYHVLAVGYALDLLGARFPGAARPFAGHEPAEVIADVERLPWRDRAWHAGAHVDTLGTALTWAGELDSDSGLDGERSVPAGARETLIGWLLSHRDPGTGLWGSPRENDGLREPVNGTYRLVRGTLAQWGTEVGGGEALVDTVLRHARQSGVLNPRGVTACDALDVAHLLWWARFGGARGYREAEVAAVAQSVVDVAVTSWVEGRGIAFAPGGTSMGIVSGVDPSQPSLQGTEMWLATLWYAADLLGQSSALGYRPQGIHRPEPRA